MTIDNLSSFYMMQVRSMWVPKNWYWYAALLIGLVSYKFPVYVPVIFFLLISICMHYTENYICFYDNIDVKDDRSLHLPFIILFAALIEIFGWVIMNFIFYMCDVEIN